MYEINDILMILLDYYIWKSSINDILMILLDYYIWKSSIIFHNVVNFLLYLDTNDYE